MAHPLIPQILDLAAPVAQSLGLEVVTAVFHTHQSPPVLRVDVRNTKDDTGLEDCEQMSRALEAVLDESDLILDAYVLEISSPGISKLLTTDREFTSFRGFPVIVTTSEPFNNRAEWTGNLVRRDDDAVHINLKGRAIAVPRTVVKTVELADGEE
ncbi:ribosome maturation factor RimP [Myxacorys almedinensis]|uniref:Ribosome maturation factor RimP n=1 Tax=Myxacorys almedinensis A TaxID=2690445 RepID=A0A8J7Z8G2_9CYAN|nr:ribosome maturation factor RimP [Myxacorys almedinensis]NDJ17385.1 ribosome maturation factor RimP [Myxacorys almedinensis A]